MLDEQERMRRWRLVLGDTSSGQGQDLREGAVSEKGVSRPGGKREDRTGRRDRGTPDQSEAEQGTGRHELPTRGIDADLGQDERRIDSALHMLYDEPRSAGLGRSSPNVARWLGDIRRYFPTPVVQMLQQDALERLGMKELLREPEILESIEPDVSLVATLLSLSRALPEETKDAARHVVRKVVEEVARKLANPLLQAVRGSLNRASRTSRPRAGEIDWHRTILANLKNYQAEQSTVVVERLIGHTRKRSSLRHVILCVDQSGSMASSLVYAGIFGAVLASLRAVTTRMVVFSETVVDLSDELHDPVDLLFGVQLGGGTNIANALAYCQQRVERPEQTILVLITDLEEGGDRNALLRRAEDLVSSGVQVICLLALSDQGEPSFHHGNAQAFAALGIPVFACTPDVFPDVMATAIRRGDLAQWAASREMVVVASAQAG